VVRRVAGVGPRKLLDVKYPYWNRGLFHSVSTELALAETEQAVRESLLTDRRTIPDATRDLYPHEIRAQVHFAELDANTTEAAAAIAREWAGIRDQALATLRVDLGRLPDTLPAILDRLAELNSPTAARPPLDLDLAAAIDRIEQLLLAAQDAAATQVVAEATRQGLPTFPLPPASTTPSRPLLRAVANHVANHAAAHVVQAAERAARSTPADNNDPVREHVLNAANDASTAAGDDLANQAAHRAAGAGRQTAALNGPEPREIYASELLDRNTCTPCSHVDGHSYPTLTAALNDYPFAGAYRACVGGMRCRGTLVFVWDEATPTR
jgi:hypothetical protein